MNYKTFKSPFSLIPLWVLIVRRFTVVMVLLLILAAVSTAGCINIQISSSESPEFSLQVSSPSNVSIIRNWSAMNLEVSLNLITPWKGGESLSTENMTLVFLKLSGDVTNVIGLENYPIGGRVYVIPPSFFMESPSDGWKAVSFLVKLRNGSYVPLEVKVAGEPSSIAYLPMTLEVNRTENGYRMKLLITGIPAINVLGKEYKVIPYPVNETIGIAGFPRERYLGNWTYVLPVSNTEVNGNTRLTVSYPIANLYLVGNGRRIFLRTINFPYGALGH